MIDVKQVRATAAASGLAYLNASLQTEELFREYEAVVADFDMAIRLLKDEKDANIKLVREGNDAARAADVLKACVASIRADKEKLSDRIAALNGENSRLQQWNRDQQVNQSTPGTAAVPSGLEKFPPGTRVSYATPSNTIYGVVASAEATKEAQMGCVIGHEVVWAYFSGSSTPTWISATKVVKA